MALHPDKNKAPQAGEAFKLIGQAQHHLGEETRRLHYNVRLAAGATW